MLLLPFMGLGLAKLHAVGTAAWIGGRHYSRCRHCVYRDCHRYSDPCPRNKNFCPREETGAGRECQ